MKPCIHALPLAGIPASRNVRCAIGAAVHPTPVVCRQCVKRDDGSPPAMQLRPPERIPDGYDPTKHLHEGGCSCDPPLE